MVKYSAPVKDILQMLKKMIEKLALRIILIQFPQILEATSSSYPMLNFLLFKSIVYNNFLQTLT